MKLLFDENLSYRLVRLLADIYPDSAYIGDFGLLGALDSAIWEFAAEHGFMLVSKDADFFERSGLYGAPPKVVWLRIGNAPTSKTAGMLRDHYVIVRRFYDDPDATLLALPLR